MDMKNLLEELEEVVDGGTAIPFVGKKMVDQEEVFRIIQAINTSLPNELEAAKAVMADKERIIMEAQKQADNMIAQAKDYIAKITEESELVKNAQERANEIITYANNSADEMKGKSLVYATDVLRYVETNMEAKLDELRKNRESLMAENESTGVDKK